MITFGQSIYSDQTDPTSKKQIQTKKTQLQGEHHSVHQWMVKVPAFCFRDVYRRLIILLQHVTCPTSLRFSLLGRWWRCQESTLVVHIHCGSPLYRNSRQYRSRTCIFKHIPQRDNCHKFHRDHVFPTYLWNFTSISKLPSEIDHFYPFFEIPTAVFSPRSKISRPSEIFRFFDVGWAGWAVNDWKVKKYLRLLISCML